MTRRTQNTVLQFNESPKLNSSRIQLQRSKRKNFSFCLRVSKQPYNLQAI